MPPDHPKGGETTCLSCKWFMPVSPGHAAICFEKWRRLKWNDAVPLTSAEKWCDHHVERARAAARVLTMPRTPSSVRQGG